MQIALTNALKMLAPEVHEFGVKPEDVRGDPLLCHWCGMDVRQTTPVLYATGDACHLFCDDDCLQRWQRARELLLTEELLKENGFDPR
jgi:hypothetical protein